MQVLPSIFFLLFSFFVIGCTSDLKTTSTANHMKNLSHEVASLRRDVDSEKAKQMDLLSPINFEKAERSLSAAEDDLKAKNLTIKSSEKISQELSESQTWLMQAKEVAVKSRSELSAPLEARYYASSLPDREDKMLSTVDEKLKKIAIKIENKKSYSPQELTKVTDLYADVERTRIAIVKLGLIEERIKQAKIFKAKALAPISYAKAQIDLKAAKESLKVNPYDRDHVAERIEIADQSSTELVEIAKLTANTPRRIPEDVVLANRRYEKMQQTQLKLAAAKDAAASTKLAQAGLNAENQKLKTTIGALEKIAEPQEVLDKLQKQLPEDKAEILMKPSGQVVIRVKDLQFKTNSSELTPTAAARLTEVKSALSMIEPKKLLIEGHTDSTGSAKINEELSQSRAKIVATVLESDEILKKAEFETKGVGAEKPLKNNQSKEGRAENRRVDIIVESF